LPSDENSGRILRQIVDLGLEIKDFETDQSGLEEVFIQLTGLKDKENGS
jgi:ABC-2 type transport system ATP-binding protein